MDKIAALKQVLARQFFKKIPATFTDVDVITHDIEGEVTSSVFFSEVFNEHSYMNIEFSTRFMQMLQIMPNTFAHATFSFIDNENIVTELNISEKHVNEKHLTQHALIVR